MDWLLECSGCRMTRGAEGLPTVCPGCGEPWLVRYPGRALGPSERAGVERGEGMWRFAPLLPLVSGEVPVTLGEGGTPLLDVPRLGARLGIARLWIKDESTNPTGSFKARGLAMAVTRAARAGAEALVIPTAGNAGVALAAYGARAGLPVKVFAPRSTPSPILAQIRAYGAALELLDGHIGDCGRAAQTDSERSGAFNLSTLREPYRMEGKKTMGFELAAQLGWTLPDAIVYPAGGGTGLIGMWLAFAQLLAAGWTLGPPPRLYAVQSSGCAPVVRAFEAGAARCEPWVEPWTVAAGLQVPNPLGGGLMLRAMRETGGGAIAVTDAELSQWAARVTAGEGIDLSPEGGASVAGVAALRRRGLLRENERVVAFNTGAGWLYRG